LQAPLHALKQMMTLPPEQREMLARRLVQQLVLTVQGALMLQHAPLPMAEAFVLSRSDAANGRVYGTLPAGSADAASLQQSILARAWPQ
jgi:putative acyl-CoA dehydrogenase